MLNIAIISFPVQTWLLCCWVTKDFHQVLGVIRLDLKYNFFGTLFADCLKKLFRFSSYLIDRDSDPRREFVIDPETGQVRTRKKLDREIAPKLAVLIKAVDKGEGSTITSF